MVNYWTAQKNDIKNWNLKIAKKSIIELFLLMYRSVREHEADISVGNLKKIASEILIIVFRDYWRENHVAWFFYAVFYWGKVDTKFHVDYAGWGCLIFIIESWIWDFTTPLFRYQNNLIFNIRIRQLNIEDEIITGFPKSDSYIRLR